MSLDKNLRFRTNLSPNEEKEFAREGMILLKRTQKKRGRPPKSIINTLWGGDVEMQKFAWFLEDLQYELPDELAHLPWEYISFCRDAVEAIFFSPKGIHFPTFFSWQNQRVVFSDKPAPLMRLSEYVTVTAILSSGQWVVQGTIQRACIAKYFTTLIHEMTKKVTFRSLQENPFISSIAPIIAQEALQRHNLAVRFLEHFTWGAYIKRT